jgi:hypothetical protein
LASTKTKGVSLSELITVSVFSTHSPSKIRSTEVIFVLRFKILEFEGGIGYIELLYRTNIMALVGGGDKPKWLPNKVMIWDDSQMKVIGEINFKKQIRGVKMR